MAAMLTAIIPQSAVVFFEALATLGNKYMLSLPLYADHFLTMIITMCMQFKVTT